MIAAGKTSPKVPGNYNIETYECGGAVPAIKIAPIITISYGYSSWLIAAFRYKQYLGRLSLFGCLPLVT